MLKMMQTSSNIESIKPQFQKPFPLTEFTLCTIVYQVIKSLCMGTWTRKTSMTEMIDAMSKHLTILLKENNKNKICVIQILERQ